MLLVGLLIAAGGIVGAATQTDRAGFWNALADHKFHLVTGLARAGWGLLLLMVGQLALAIRDIARNSFR